MICIEKKPHLHEFALVVELEQLGLPGGGFGGHPRVVEARVGDLVHACEPFNPFMPTVAFRNICCPRD